MCERGKTTDIKDLRRDEGRDRQKGRRWEQTGRGGFIFETMKNS